ncbi:MAG: polysaccharide pyruvyl transferase family protein [Desulfobacteraceae bacterium]|nr:polysaccharide pyruvyl transferase family protein [Desulfobacteraceae bacterium]
MAVVRKYNNYVLMRHDSPICYIYADAINIGDKTSSLGVNYLTGRRGVELFSSPAGLGATFRSLKWLEKNRPDTAIIVGGGGLLQGCFESFWKGLIATSLRFSLFGVGANEIQGKRSLPSDEVLRMIVDRASTLHVRDKWTRELLLYHGRGKEISVGVCPAVNYLVSRYGSTGGGGERNYLLHVQHPVDIRMAGGNYDLISRKLKKIAFDLHLHYDETDHIQEDLDSLVTRYRRARFVVTSRLHGCIFSYALNTPFVAMVTDTKTSAFIVTHVPGNPRIGVHSSKEEILRQISLCEGRHSDSQEKYFQAAIFSNEVAMRKALDVLTTP